MTSDLGLFLGRDAWGLWGFHWLLHHCCSTEALDRGSPMSHVDFKKTRNSNITCHYFLNFHVGFKIAKYRLSYPGKSTSHVISISFNVNKMYVTWRFKEIQILRNSISRVYGPTAAPHHAPPTSCQGRFGWGSWAVNNKFDKATWLFLKIDRR